MKRLWVALSLLLVSFQNSYAFDTIYKSKDFCSLYPLTIPSALVTTASPGTSFNQVSLGTGSGNYSWLTWNGSNSANAISASLLPPGNSNLYENPNDATDNKLEVGEWVQGAPGVKNSKKIRNGLDALLHNEIIVPVWQSYEGSGSNLNYYVSNFAIIELTDYKLNGKGYISFVFKRFSRCYNTTPTTTDAHHVTHEDTPVTFDLPAHDEDNDDLIYTIADQPQNGVLTQNGGSVTYTPAQNYFGVDQFTFYVDDGEDPSETATVTLDVLPINDAPLADSKQVELNEDTSIALALTGNDIENDILSFSIVSQPTHGVLQGTAPNLTYIPNPDYNGSDLFTYISNDGVLDSAPAQVSINVLPVNDAPVAEDVSVETEENLAVNINLSGSDIDGDALTFTIVVAPSSGVLSGAGAALTYTPNPGFFGHDRFDYVANDGELDSSPASVNIDVIRVNEPPSIISPPVTASPESQLYQYQVIVSDPNEHDGHLYQLDAGPAGMSIDLSQGLVSWMPTADYVGTVPTFNRQCYVVPTGSVKLFDENDPASGQTYISPLFLEVKDALENGAEYTAREAVAWHNRNGCLGCHVQTQSYLGLSTSLDKADVDEVATQFLYNALVDNQQLDGSIRMSHPEFSKLQTALAVWALNSANDEGAFQARIKALEFFWGKQISDQNTTYWTLDYVHGWWRWTESMTMMVAQTAVKTIADSQFYSVTPEQQQVLDNYISELPAITNYFLAAAYQDENETLISAYRLVALAELKTQLTDIAQLLEVDAAIDHLDALLRARQLAEGGWNRYGNGSASDPLTSAWVGIALDYQNPSLTDPVVINNIEYLLQAQQANGTWATNSGLFTTRFAATSLVMAYLPIALEHLGNPDIRVGHILLNEGLDSVYTLSADIVNRGLADVTVPVTVNFYQGEPTSGQLIGSTVVNTLTSGSTNRASIQVDDQVLVGDISVVIDVDASIDECQITNNKAKAAVVRLRATDQGDLYDTQVYTLNIDDVNEAPLIISSPKLSLEGGQSYNYQVEILDLDRGDAHTYEIIQGPTGLYIDPRTGKFSSLPDVLQPGTHPIIVRVTDLRGLYDEQMFDLQVNENHAPYFTSIAESQGNESSGYQYQAMAEDSNLTDVLKFGLESGPEGFLVDAASGMASWTEHGDYIDVDTNQHSVCRAEAESDFGQLQPVLKFEWNSSETLPSYVEVLSTPSVAQLTDDNLDGQINLHDIPDIIFSAFRDTGIDGFASEGVVRAISGSDGNEIFTVDDSAYRISGYGNLAVADIDNDGLIEIIALRPVSDQGIIVFEHDGSFKWKSSIPNAVKGNWGAISIADVDADGSPEIISGNTVLNADGSLHWQGSGYTGTSSHRGGRLSIVADIDLDGKQEVVAGAAAYDDDGTLLWQNSMVGDGFAAIGNFDATETPEIAVVSNGYVSLLDSIGNLQWGPVALPGGGRGGAPTVADMDGDGLPEIGVAGAKRYVVFDTDGTILWQTATLDASSNVTGSSVFDFNGDGNAEVVYADELHLRVYEGKTGITLFEVRNTSGTAFENPVIVDVDNDGHAEVIVAANEYLQRLGWYPGPGNQGIRVFEAAEDNWAPTRSIWNQHSYHITNVNDDGTIPQHEQPSWLTHNTYRLNTFIDRHALSLSDVIVHSINLDTANNRITALVKNRGLAPVNGDVSIDIYHEHLWNGDTLLGTASVSNLAAGEEHEISINVTDLAEVTDSIRAEINSDQAIEECAYDNNTARAAVVDLRVYDPAGLYDVQKFAVSGVNTNDAPEITSAASSTGYVNAAYAFNVTVSDPDAGDGFVYELINAPAGVAINEFTGVVKADTLAEGIYQYTIRVTDLAGATDEQNHILTVTQPDNWPPEFTSTPATQVFALADYYYQAQATDVDGDEVVYLLSNAPAGMHIDGVTGEIFWAPTLGQRGSHNVQVTALDVNGATTHQYYIIDVLDPLANNLPPVIESEPSGNVYAGQVYEYPVIASDADGDPLNYSLLNAQGGMNIDTQGLFSWVAPSDLIGAAVTFSIVVEDGRGGRAEQVITMPINASANTPPQITSEPQFTAAVGELYQYAVQATDADGDTLTVSLDVAPNGMSIDVNGVVTWTPAAAQAEQSFEVKVKVADARGAINYQTYQVYVNNAQTPNVPPRIVSSPTTPAIIDALYSYELQAQDLDGDALTYSLDQAPVGMSIDVNGLLQWTPAIDQLGPHSIVIRVSDGRAYTTQSYTLEVIDAVGTGNQHPEIVSEPVYEAAVDYNYLYGVVANDPDGDALTYELLNGPSGMIIDNAGFVQWRPTLDQAGSHEVQIKVSDGQLAVIQTYGITVYDQPLPLTVTLLVSPQTVDAGADVLVSVYTEGGQGQINRNLTIDGLPIALDAFGTARVTAATIGVHDIVVTATDDVTTVTETSYYSVRDPGDVTPPMAQFTLPENDSVITAPTALIGTASDDNLVSYRILVSPRGKAEWQTIVESSLSVIDNELAQFDPTMLLNGQYDVILEAIDANDQRAYDNLVLSVDGDLKVGNFAFTLLDLEIPVSGIPIRVTRTYDSRRRAESLDFGYGWSVGYQNVKMEESRIPGLYWSLNQYNRGPFGLVVDFCVEPQGAPVVTVTLPNGDVESFEAAASPQCNTYQPFLDVSLVFNAVGDTQSTLEALNDTTGRLHNGHLVEQSTFSDPINPSRYKLTTREGYVYLLNQDFGIETVTDPNGHTLTYSNNGIVHSSGKSVLFNRDSDGRITSITDPNGNQYSYDYNLQGDLVSSVDALLAETTYRYNGNHGLLNMVDPLGRNIVKNIYDDSGRLIAQEDSDGNRTDFNHDIDGRLSVVTDRLGNATQYYYDERGNVTTQIDALGNTTTYTHDARGNQLSQTDALGNTATATYNAANDQLTQTDALGNTVEFSYNSRGQELTVQDARGNVFTNTYDSVGNLLSIKDPLDNLAGQNIDANGNVSKRIDAAGNETSFTYDSEGNALSETDPLGNTVSNTYDANGNVLTETRTRLIDGLPVDETTSYVYDAQNRLIQTTDPLGHVTQTEYDASGNETARIDALGNRTEFVYDAYRRLLQTTYPDLSTEINRYDAEGNLISSTDRAGRTTSYRYDALNRQTGVTYADGSTTRTEYDILGRVIAEIDANNNRTEYGYDDAGRRTRVTDALGNITTFSYDADGNLVSQRDANNHTVSYVYDALDRRTQTTYHDSSVMTEAYDPLGRVISQTDQGGKVTQYEYDALGRLTAVIETRNSVEQRTEYTYDEVGNKLSQRDANGNTTTWTYDALGRVLSRTLPLGQTETYTYDANGNQISHTDFNGNTTTYAYDSDNRLVKKTYPDTREETYTYNAVGNRLSATDSNGTTTYVYDNRDRLTKETKPDSNIIEYQYDNMGNRTQVKTTVSATVDTTDYTYDSLNRLATVTDNALNVTNYTYDNVGNRASVSYANGNVTTYTYDSLNRLTYQETQNAANTMIASYDYTLASTGHRTQVIDHSGATTSYSYDDLNRLIGEDLTNHPILGAQSNSYEYDAVGNRTYSIENGVHTEYTYDANDRLTQAGGESYTYDANGNTLSVSIDNTHTAYSYDYNNRLIQMIKTENSVDIDNVTYQYDIDGLRIAKNDDGNQTHYLVDKNRDYGQVIKELDSTNATTVDYLYGDDLIKQTRAANDAYYLYDGHGSTRALADGTGNITDTYDYNAYGQLIDSTGATDNSYLYTGEQFDQSLSNYYLRARYYDPNNGRFTTMDTWMGVNSDPVTLNKYAYGNLDPVNYIDPTGNFGLTSLSAGINVRGVLATTSFARYGFSLVQSIGSRAVVNSTLGMVRSFSSQINRFINGGKKVANIGSAISKAVRGFRKFTQSKKFKNGQGFHYLDVSGPSSLKQTPAKFTQYRKITRKIHVRYGSGGKPGRVFEIKYKIGLNGQPAKGTGFTFRVDYQDYVFNPPKFKPHYHLCYGEGTSCKDHNYF